MGFLVNKTTKKIHEENCIFVNANYQKTKNKKDCKFKYFKTKKAAENYFIQQDKQYAFCKLCNK